MILNQYYLECLSHASYLVADAEAGEAIVVDPRRDVGIYLRDAAESGLRIVGIINTHLHADFVAGHLELAAATGAWIGLGYRAEVDYPFRPLRHGETVDVGEVRLDVLETPGHTWESISLLVRHTHDGGSQAVLTGDALFVGDVGRPDLAAEVGADPDELARALRRSLHEVLLALPDEVRVLPAHGAGSLCGKNLSPERESTIGIQRQSNPALRPMPEAEFVRMITTGQPSVPEYFAYDAALNRSSHALLNEEPHPVRLSAAEAARMLREGTKLLDARSPSRFARGHLPGSVNVGINGRFAETAGMIVTPDDSVVVVVDADRAAEAVVRLGRIGCDNVAGWIDPATEDFASKATQEGRRVAAEDLDQEKARRGPVLLDVRNVGELEVGALAGSVNIPLAELPRRLGELPSSRPIIAYCTSGRRSSVAASILRTTGFWRAADISDLAGGYKAWSALHPAGITAAGR
ncbi:rhodanese-like domain-containing protein [Arthrobacter sp. M4]|uniref:MBL fold metallo-hydrolase n=1 Tax=Arthrobacter sp. M4 TaxID=218160 RepID=UPI001CDC3E46|nr:MBL fold metallo-hydrolase [Arthrobacter sp. M4]MCA4131257.1 MBL fold metallo-hydrolase [Arthrobacter sp. M4]